MPLLLSNIIESHRVGREQEGQLVQAPEQTQDTLFLYYPSQYLSSLSPRLVNVCKITDRFLM